MSVLIENEFASFLFISVSMALIALEVFIPSGGVIGLTACIFGGLGIYGFLHQGNNLLAGLSVTVMLAFILAMIFFMVRRTQLNSVLTADTAGSTDEAIPSLSGKEGVTSSALRPAGLALIDGKKVDVVATGRFIEKDKRVKVVDVSGNRVVVREL